MAEVANRNRRIEQAAQQGQEASQQATQSTTGQVIGAAGTALGIYGKVMGFTNGISEDLLMPAFQALSFMQGIACLPASSQLDPVMGVDVHLVMIPPSPSPVPIPHPYIATIFDEKDYLSCAVMTAAAMAAPEPTGNDDADAAASLAFSVATMALGMAGMTATVKLGSFTPRTTTGVQNKTIKHFPLGASFAPVPVLKDSGHCQFGSLFLTADGNPFAGALHMNNDCWDLGIMQLIRKKYPPEPMHLYMPTGLIAAIPSHNVIVNPVPTPVNPIAALTNILNAGFAKILHKITRYLPPGLRNALNKVICHVTGHPVDVVSGMLFTDEEDFFLPGIISFSWERTWYSDSNYKGPLGHGWYHSYDMAIHISEENNQAIFRMNDGRGVVFQLPQPGKFTFDRNERLFLHCHAEEKTYYITDKNGLIYRFTRKTFKDNQTKTECNFLQSIANNNGYAIRFEYNNNGLLSKVIDTAGRILVIENDIVGRITNIIAPHPNEPSKTFIIAHYDYNDAGDMICHTDALNQKMDFEYQNHLLVKETWRNGQNWHFRYDGTSTGSKCIHTWGDGDLYNHKLTYTDGMTVVENSLGYNTVYYHKNGLPYIKIDGNGSEWQYRYNRYNELEWETDPLGNQTNYSHDEWGNIITTTDPAGGFMAFEFFHPKFPLLRTEAMDAAGGKWKWEYDEQGNLVTKISPLGAETTFEYLDGLLSKMRNPTGATTLLAYDKQQNLIKIVTDNNAVTEYGYDALGNCISIINANNLKQKRTFDLKSRIEKMNDFDGNIINLEYDGIDNILHYQDKQKNIEYSYRGRTMISRKESGVMIVFSYNTEQQLRKITNEHGSTYRFELDPTGKAIEEIGFDNIRRRYERDKAGWVKQILGPSGKFTKYSYDACGRITEIIYSDETKETFNYRPDGTLKSATNEFATIEFERNVMGDIVKETINGEWTQSIYDSSRKRTKITSSLGANINHSYNDAGQVQLIEAGEWFVKFECDKQGLEINRLLPGGVSSYWQRDGIGRPIIHTIGRYESNVFNSKKRKHYQWDVNDRLKQIKDEKGLTKFEYDAWSNLAKAVYPNGEVQLRNPDAVGNLYKTAEQNERLYGKGGQIKKGNGWEYIYDDAGNLIEKKGISGELWNYFWNDAGMLIKIIKPDKTEVMITYDALGRRLSKQYKSTITKFLWDGNTLLHEWKEHATTRQKLNDLKTGDNEVVTWLFDVESFAPAGKIKGNKKYSIIADHIGTPSQMYKEDGTLFWECELDSYGKLRMELGETGSCPFRYQGQYEDRETGLYYNRFRYYDNETGLYITQDPIRLNSAQPNFYSYVTDVNKYIDALGLYNGEGERDLGEYDVHHEHQLQPSEYRNSDADHFARGNESLHNRFQRDPAFANAMEARYPGIKDHVAPGANGRFSGDAPRGTTWHHHETPGKLQLVDRADHRKYHKIYHPDGEGGRKKWGGGDECR